MFGVKSSLVILGQEKSKLCQISLRKLARRQQASHEGSIGIYACIHDEVKLKMEEIYDRYLKG